MCEFQAESGSKTPKAEIKAKCLVRQVYLGLARRQRAGDVAECRVNCRLAADFGRGGECMVESGNATQYGGASEKDKTCCKKLLKVVGKAVKLQKADRLEGEVRSNSVVW